MAHKFLTKEQKPDLQKKMVKEIKNLLQILYDIRNLETVVKLHKQIHYKASTRQALMMVSYTKVGDAQWVSKCQVNAALKNKKRCMS